METSGLSCPTQTGSLTGQGQSDQLWDDIEDHRVHQALPQPKSAPLFPSGRPQALSLTPDPHPGGDMPLTASCHCLVPFPRNLLVRQAPSFLTAAPKQAHGASFSL